MLYQHIIITGASSGFGLAYARRLAYQCQEMILIARRGDILLELKRELAAAYPQLKVRCLSCDLADAAQRDALMEDLKSSLQGSTLLINNAGFGDYGCFADGLLEKQRSMIEVNIAAPTYLSHTLIPHMIKEGGAMMNIASLAADLFIPDFAIYAASKAYVASMSEALHIELKEYHIPVLAVCPGPVHTGFGEVARRKGFTGNMTPGKDVFDTSISTVIEGSLKALEKGKSRYYPSLKIRALALLIRNMPLAVMRLILSFRPRRVQSQKGDAA